MPKVAIVTGGGGPGCGRAIAQRLANEGFRVVVADIDVNGGHETVRLIAQAGQEAKFVRTDVGMEGDVRAMIAFAESSFGRLDVVVNNAGSYHPQLLEFWMENIQSNLHGVVYGTLHAIEAMRRHGGGAIVNFGSTSSLGFGHSNSPSYDAAKSAVMRLTGGLACLKEQYGIRVNCVVPHWIATPEVSAYVNSLTLEERRQRKVPDVLLSTDEIADAVLRLATDETLAGRILVCHGGEPPRFLPNDDSLSVEP
jgi:NAD(P)-dependent dehydrogenase (short-subunit alcohol dehydrogenase family)